MRKVMLNIWKLVVQIHRTCSIQLKPNLTHRSTSLGVDDGNSAFPIFSECNSNSSFRIYYDSMHNVEQRLRRRNYLTLRRLCRYAREISRASQRQRLPPTPSVFVCLVCSMRFWTTTATAMVMVSMACMRCILQSTRWQTQQRNAPNEEIHVKEADGEETVVASMQMWF